MKKYDVIIIGAGPAGVSCAKVLKDNNISFCIIEKNKFPREKLCGGGLTNKSVNILKKLGLKIDKIKSLGKRNMKMVYKSISKDFLLDNDIVMIDRIEFDYNNLKQVVYNNYFEEEKLINIDNNILFTDKDKYEFKYIVFADGVNGYSRKFITNRKYGFCVEYDAKIDYSEIVLDFNIINGGYGWIFPKLNHTVIGLGNFTKKRENYKELLINFAKKYNIEIDESKIRGYHIPVFSKRIYKKSVINDKYILIGDAASLVDSVSGEGIYYALLSGMISAYSIINCLNNNTSLSTEYFKNSKSLLNSLIKRNIVRKLLYSFIGSILVKITLKNKKLTNVIKRVFG